MRRFHRLNQLNHITKKNIFIFPLILAILIISIDIGFNLTYAKHNALESVIIDDLYPDQDLGTTKAEAVITNNVLNKSGSVHNPWYAFAIDDFSIAEPLIAAPEQKILIDWPRNFDSIALHIENRNTAHGKLTVATSVATEPYARFLLEYTAFNQPKIHGKTVAAYWKSVKRYQKILTKTEGCLFVDHALRVTKLYLIYTEKTSNCKFRRAEFVTYGKILRGHDGFYHVNYQFKPTHNNDDIDVHTAYKLAVRGSKLVSYKRF